MSVRLVSVLFALPSLLVACSSSSPSPTSSSTSGGTACVPGASVACACIDGKTGAQQCAADGRSFGACFCVGPSSSSGGETGGGGGAGGGSGGSSTSSGGSGGGTAGDAVWASALGGVAGAEVLAVAVDSKKRVVAAGYFGGTITLGTKSFTCEGSSTYCAFVTQLDASMGKVLWSAGFVSSVSGDGRIDQTVLAIGPNDEVYVAGGFANSIDFGQGPIGAAGVRSLYVVRFDASGTLEQSLHFDALGNGAALTANGAVVQSNGHLVLEGDAVDTVDFGQGQVGPGTYLVDLAPNGLVHFSTAFANTAQDPFMATGGTSTLARTANDDLVLGGEATGSPDLGCGDPIAAGDAFVVGLDATGACRWASAYPGVHVSSVAVDPGDDSAAIGGSLAGGSTVTIGSDTLTGVGQYDALLFHIGAAGEELWGRSFGVSGARQWTYGVAVAPSGDIGVSGWSPDGIDFGNGPLAGTGQIFAATFERDATPHFGARLGSIPGYGLATAFAGNDRPVFAGSFFGTMAFASKFIQSNGPGSGFVVELAVP